MSGARSVARTGDRSGFGLLGVAAAACVACCAGPVLALLGGLGLAGLGTSLFVGAAGLLVAVLALVTAIVVAVRRRARTSSAAVGPTPLHLSVGPTPRSHR